ncbi:response regulator transcription factor [Modicisalibacter coralii]|uniref:response regulator transcription factor n=1 Tax=Modicisalibacter coralii TaxID=2304602 RepID=UPI00100BF0F5|nr:LuxR C-terminal-related transcriptional regulator [Halomonas coralii]
MQDTPTIHLVDNGSARAAHDWARHLPWPVQRYAGGREFLAVWARTLADASCRTPGCVVSELRLPSMDGVAFQQRLAAHGDPPPVVFLAGEADAVLGLRAMRAGAADVLLRPLAAGELRERVNWATRGDLARCRARRQRLDVGERFARLTPREREVLDGVVDGATSKAIAAELGISPKTVELHRARIMTKLEVDSLACLVRLWLVVREGEPAAGPGRAWRR